MFLLTAMLAVVTIDDTEKIHPVVAQLQGSWEFNATSNGDAIRFLKQIEDQTETVSVFRNGQLIQKHVVQFTVTDEGPVTVFRWTGGKHIGGVRNGQPLADGAAVLRIVDDQWISVEGLLKGDPPRFALQRFRRPK